MIRCLALAAGAGALMAPAPARPATRLSAEVSSVECVYSVDLALAAGLRNARARCPREALGPSKRC